MGAVAWGQGVEYNWDPSETFTAENHLVTNIPSTFVGADVAALIGADTYYNNGIDGSGTISSNIEAGHAWGTSSGHETLTHVTSYTHDSSAPGSGWETPAYDRHATWVGMMIGGRQGGSTPGTYQTGIAPGTDLRSGAIATHWNGSAYATSFGVTGTSFDYPYSSGASAFGTADVINSSWGGTGGDRAAGMDAFSQTTDALGNGNAATTFVASAGNGGSGSNRVGAPGAGYNGITVAALANNGSNVYDTVASFSSRGPQDYGDPVNGTISEVRAAVDIAAPGTHLTSAYFGGASGGNDPKVGGTATGGTNLYSGGLQGTSFSAPITAGAVALMDAATKAQGLAAPARDARVIKAVMLNAADRPANLNWDNGQSVHGNGNGGVVTTQSLDYASGAGALDMDRTYTQQLGGQTDVTGLTGGATGEHVGWDYGTVAADGANDLVITPQVTAGTEMRFTLAWFRERVYNGVGSVNDVGFANLDLQVFDSTFTTLYSESISTYNSVEHLTFTAPVTGQYGVRVDYAGNVFGSLASEDYGLAWHTVPEPGAAALVVLGGVLALLRRRRAT